MTIMLPAGAISFAESEDVAIGDGRQGLGSRRVVEDQGRGALPQPPGGLPMGERDRGTGVTQHVRDPLGRVLRAQGRPAAGAARNRGPDGSAGAPQPGDREHVGRRIPFATHERCLPDGFLARFGGWGRRLSSMAPAAWRMR